jgi:hypothetical protein
VSPDSPFWFAGDELLTNLLRDEVRRVGELFLQHPGLSEFFDSPDATAPQRAVCFMLQAHCTIIDVIDETFAARYEQTPSLSEDERNMLARTRHLFGDDAPPWVLEANEVAELLPSRIYNALPEPLRSGRGFSGRDTAEIELIQSAAAKLSGVDEIQALNQKVLDQQQQRLERRWSVASGGLRATKKKRSLKRVADKQRADRDRVIAEIDAVAPTIAEFLRLMDERKVKPQPTWTEWPVPPGSWSKAYKNRRLRELIHKDKSRAMVRVRARRKG